MNSQLSQHPPTVRRSALGARPASLWPGPRGPRGSLERLTASTTAGGMLLAGVPLMMEYVVRPGDTLSEIAVDHGTSASRLVERNGLDAAGDHVVAGRPCGSPRRTAAGRGARAARLVGRRLRGPPDRALHRPARRHPERPRRPVPRLDRRADRDQRARAPRRRDDPDPRRTRGRPDGAPASAAPAAPAAAPRRGSAPSADAVDGPSRARGPVGDRVHRPPARRRPAASRSRCPGRRPAGRCTTCPTPTRSAPCR